MSTDSIHPFHPLSKNKPSDSDFTSSSPTNPSELFPPHHVSQPPPSELNFQIFENNKKRQQGKNKTERFMDCVGERLVGVKVKWTEKSYCAR
jgi:hypothetical protein